MESNTFVNPEDILFSKRRSIQISFDNEGRVVVKAPLRTPLTTIYDFINRKSKWIIKNQNSIKTKLINKPYEHYLLGEPVIIPKSIKIKDYYKSQAQDIISNRVIHYSETTSLVPLKIKITSAKRRWGSCSAHNTISFSWRLVQLPYQLIDYVVIHELCHLVHKNHSRKFWDLVSQYLPDYKTLRKQLRNNGIC